MITPIDALSLEASIVRNGAPTLTGAMPANLFTFPGRFAASTPCTAVSATEVRENRAALHDAARVCATCLERSGIRLSVLVWRGCGALLFLYRPDALERIFSVPEVHHAFETAGYPSGDLDGCLDSLAERMAARGPCAVSARHAATAVPAPQHPQRTAFPHEVGYLLGYPVADVAGFINHAGKNCLISGPWKVYQDRDRALALFERIRANTARCRQRYRRGASLTELAVACA